VSKTVYLAGAILGCDKSEANDWRFETASKLAARGITGISPLRCEPLVGERYGMNYTDPKFGTARAIAAKNLFDVRNCDMTLAYMPKPAPGRERSVGTIIECAWAFASHRPAIVVTDDEFLRDHPVLNACVPWFLDSLDDAVEVAAGILGGYVGGKNV
jgi:nucleoside 2-deoxyribosyltransferase